MSVLVNQVRRGFYLDSVALMRMSRAIAALDGVAEAALMMGTPANREIMESAGLLDKAGAAAQGGDLVVAVRADNGTAAEAALGAAQSLLDTGTVEKLPGGAWRPHTLRSAVQSTPDSNLALISVPGDFAVAEARKAIRHGLHVMIFSDNVDLAAEAALKQEALALNRMVMGPDCGTAIINGVPLAFANQVPRGAIGVIGASGTGLQEVTSLIARQGGGISQAIGVGGRDLSREIGGVSTLMALDALAADEETETIVIVSKPPPEAVSKRVLEQVGTVAKPVIVCFIGANELPVPDNVSQVATLKAASAAACGAAAIEAPAPDEIVSGSGTLVRGLFSGGTLCAESQAVLCLAGETVASNSPIPGARPLSASPTGHSLIDLGDDAYTRGRPHPMIDPTVRDAEIERALADKNTGVVLVDVVIGHGAHADPAGHLARQIGNHTRTSLPPIIASVTGTEADPQCRSAQIAKLEAVGIHVAPTNADAAAWALAAVRSGEG